MYLGTVKVSTCIKGIIIFDQAFTVSVSGILKYVCEQIEYAYEFDSNNHL